MGVITNLHQGGDDGARLASEIGWMEVINPIVIATRIKVRGVHPLLC